jgi:hypothetical protein
MDAKDLWKLLEDAGLEPASYSGRGMHGRHCVSIKGTSDECEVIADMVAQAVISGADVLDLCDVIRSTRTDSLGMGVVMYWPGLKLDE